MPLEGRRAHGSLPGLPWLSPGRRRVLSGRSRGSIATNVHPYLLVFAASAGVTFLATPLVRRLSDRLGWIDHPSDRKVHPKPTPTAGGIAMYLGVVVGLLVGRAVPFLSDLYETSSELDAAIVASTAVVVLGIVDDTRGVSAIGKLAGQVLVAGLVVLLGVQLLYFYFPGQGVLSLSPDLAVPLTVLWIVALMNAVKDRKSVV